MPASESLDIKISGSATGFAGAAKQVTNEINRIRGAVGNLPRDLVTRGFGAAAAFLSAGNLIRTVRGVMRMADAVDDMSKRLGISAERFQEWGFAMRQAGLDAGALSQPLRVLSLALAQAQAGNKSSRAALAALGLTPGMSAEQAFGAIGGRLSGRRATAAEFAALNSVLGRTAFTLLPVFSDGLDKATKRARELGQVLRDDTVKRLADANKAIEVLQNKMRIAVGEGVGGVFKNWRRGQLLREVGGGFFGAELLAEAAIGREGVDPILRLEGLLDAAKKRRAGAPGAGGAAAAGAADAVGFRTQADELARMGLFRGGGADPAQRLRMQQLRELQGIRKEQSGMRTDMRQYLM